MNFPTILLFLSGLTLARSMINPFWTSVYYDYTSFIDNYLQGNEAESGRLERIQADTERHSAYYSTDSLISDLAELHPVTDLIRKFANGSSTSTGSPILNFRLVSNASNTLKDGIFEDLFYDPSEIRLADTESLRNIGGIILDLTRDTNGPSCLIGPTVDYLQELNISLALHAKMLAGRILGTNSTSARVKVGVKFNLEDTHCKFIRLQLAKADFIVADYKFTAVKASPISLGAFRDFVGYAQKGSLTMHNFTAPLTFHLTMVKNDSFVKGLTKDSNLQRLLKESQEVYFLLLEEYAVHWLWNGRRHLAKQIILTSPDGVYHTAHEVMARHFWDFRDFDWKYLFVKETEVGPCALQTMLSNMGRPDIIVDEYTWTALVHHQSEMDLYPTKSGRQCPNATSIYGRPQRIHMIISKGTGRVWEPFRPSLETLLRSHSSVAEYTLSTVLFHASDIDQSELRLRQDGEFRLPQDGIRNFVRNFPKAQTNISFGCVADLGPLRNADDSTYLVSKVKKDCEPLMDRASILIWKFEINFAVIDNFPLRLSFEHGQHRSPSSFKYKLFQIFAARNKFMEEFEGKEVIIQLQPDETFFQRYAPNSNSSNCFEQDTPYDSYIESLRVFGKIHGVKMVIQPAYDVKHPWFGIEGIPTFKGEGTSNRPNCFHILSKKKK